MEEKKFPVAAFCPVHLTPMIAESEELLLEGFSCPLCLQEEGKLPPYPERKEEEDAGA